MLDVFECQHCDGDIFYDYSIEEIWYEECSDGSYNCYVTMHCPMCGWVSVPV